jgi:hypothetical protein
MALLSAVKISTGRATNALRILNPGRIARVRKTPALRNAADSRLE